MDFSRSWLMGDTATEARNLPEAGRRSVLVRTGHTGKEGRFAATPQPARANLAEAVNFILRLGPAERTHV